MTITIVIVIASISLLLGLLVKSFIWRKQLKSVENKHVVVTGGSSGIGKCVAIIAAKHGAHVTIIARDVLKLEATRLEVMQACKNKDVQKVEYLSLDVGKSYKEVEKAFLELEKTMGPVYMLVNCAGLAICGKIEDTSSADLDTMMHANLYSAYYCIKAVVQSMKTARDGMIVLTASQAALIGIFGYSAYCSTKFALRGLAESIAMELEPYNITVTLSLPPDTDTPGFATEELSKPLETKLITRPASLTSPNLVANQLFNDALAGKFFSTVGMDGFFLATVCSGMAPFRSIGEVILQSMLMGLFRIISVYHLLSFQRIIVKCMKTRDKNKKSE